MNKLHAKQFVSQGRYPEVHLSEKTTFASCPRLSTIISPSLSSPFILFSLFYLFSLTRNDDTRCTENGESGE